ncbi:signal recognition particle protein [bacterium]|nr:MAG: signal recognition particle protein [bacterium]QQR61535.1 MAG: signal recognition particle protein [bacterium]QQR62936.1 MAG: signal recognition particle protein [bacterium]
MFDFLAKKFGDLFELFSKETTFTDENTAKILDEIKAALIDSDVPYDVVVDFTRQVKQDLLGKKVLKNVRPDEQLLKIVYERLVKFMSQGGQDCFSFEIPSVVMVMGLQGAGKTTTIAKLVHFVKTQAEKKRKNRSILVASVDFYRPAAVEQLEIVAQQAAAVFYRAQEQNPVAAAMEIYQKFKKDRYDLLFLDTAGRLHFDEQMMQELQQINQKLLPRYKILVLDAMTGQQSLSIAQTFDQKVGFYASILTKMDSNASAGAALAFRYVLKKPIWFIGTGEKLPDLQEFVPDRIAQRMLNMGDMQTLIEKIDDKIHAAEQEKMNKALLSDAMSLEDFGLQIDMMNKVGSLSSLMKYIPGIANKLSAEQIDAGEREVKRFRAIISSMTPKERKDVTVLNDSRKQRIAVGSGTTVQDVLILLQRFEQVKQYAKLLKKSGPFGGLFR